MPLNIVQIGANRGSDDLTKIIQDLPCNNLISSLILVEPLTFHHESLRQCYLDVKNLKICGAVVAPAPSTEPATFYYHDADAPGYEVASLDPDHIRKHSKFIPALADEAGLHELKIERLTIEQIMARYHLGTIDILFMDCEGADADIVKSAMNIRPRISNIYFESVHLPDNSVFEVLEQEGYSVNRNTLSNGWMAHAAYA